MKGANEFDLLASVVGYPGEQYVTKQVLCLEALAESDPEAAMPLGEFLDKTRGFSLEDLQELYAATFDLDPACSLEVGWHLFGENYERGEFLVKMRGELRRLGVAESAELPDHLTHALAALGHMEPQEAADFATACLFPALDKIRAALKGRSNPFENALLTVSHVLEHRYPRPDPETVPAEPAFRILNSGGW